MTPSKVLIGLTPALVLVLTLTGCFLDERNHANIEGLIQYADGTPASDTVIGFIDDMIGCNCPAADKRTRTDRDGYYRYDGIAGTRDSRFHAKLYVECPDSLNVIGCAGEPDFTSIAIASDPPVTRKFWKVFLVADQTARVDLFLVTQSLDNPEAWPLHLCP